MSDWQAAAAAALAAATVPLSTLKHEATRDQGVSLESLKALEDAVNALENAVPILAGRQAEVLQPALRFPTSPLRS